MKRFQNEIKKISKYIIIYFSFFFLLFNLLQLSAHERGFSFFSFHKANKATPATLTTLNRTPGISPTAFPFLPNPEIKTSSLSSKKFKQPSFGTKAVIFLAFLINCTRTHFRIAELGCLASTPIFSRMIPFAWEEPPNGECLKSVPRARFL